MDYQRFSHLRFGRLLGNNSSVLTYFQYVIYGSLILYFGRDVFIPISFAVLISFVLYPSCAWMERKGLGRMTAILINVALLTLVVASITVLMVQQFLSFLEEWPGLQTKLLNSATDFSRLLTSVFGVSPAQQDTLMAKLTDQVASGTLSLLANAISFSAISAVVLILVPVYTEIGRASCRERVLQVV